MKMQITDVAGVGTRCVVAGEPDAPAVFLLHGLALTADVWLRNIDALAKTHRVVAPDMLGHGFTRPASDAPVDILAKVRHLRDLADALGIDKLSLCGSSYGALIASLFFLDNKQRVEKLVINGSGSCFNTEEQLVSQVAKLHALYEPTLTRSTPEMWRERIGNNFFDKSKVPVELLPIAALCYAQPWAAPRWAETMAIMGSAERFRPFRILGRLEQLTLPTLVVWGRDDKGGSLESATAAIKRMPNARLVTFDKCGHYPMIEHPEQYNELVTKFLAA
ncbi:MAG: alpha/beta hydrolase [Proteobacteria bacterium]|nr:alpha/beta hydrolase [Pseudomonadota bacterium]